MGKTSSAVKDKYNAKAYDRLVVRVPKGQKELYQELAVITDGSLNGYVNRLMREDYEKNNKK